MKNYALAEAIHRAGLRQRDFAKLVGTNRTKVCMVVNRRWALDDMSKVKWARALKKEPEELFKEE